MPTVMSMWAPMVLSCLLLRTGGALSISSDFIHCFNFLIFLVISLLGFILCINISFSDSFQNDSICTLVGLFVLPSHLFYDLFIGLIHCIFLFPFSCVIIIECLV